MSKTGQIQEIIHQSMLVKQQMMKSKLILQQIERCGDAINRALRNGHKILLCGNGGSFADAQHIAAELTCRFVLLRKAFPAICLGTNSSHLTATANDFSFKTVFAREVEALGNEGDILIAISTSGNSDNIISAVKAASKKKILVIGLSGESGGKLKEISDCICVPSVSTARIQESHITIGHIWCQMIDDEFGIRNPNS